MIGRGRVLNSKNFYKIVYTLFIILYYVERVAFYGKRIVIVRMRADGVVSYIMDVSFVSTRHIQGGGGRGGSSSLIYHTQNRIFPGAVIAVEKL